MRNLLCVITLAALAMFSGCQTVPPKDYTAFRRNHPASILVLPPINASTDVRATYSMYTTMTAPIAEMGYYVFPVVVVDQFMKENGLTMPADMQQVPIAKLRDVFGADAALYTTIDEYGSKYQVFAANTIVRAHAKLVDLRTGDELWQGQVLAQAAGQSGLVEAVVTQIMNKLTDQPHAVAAMASVMLVNPQAPPGQGLLKGPRSPDYAKQ